MMHISRFRWVRKLTGGIQVVWIFLEEKRWLSIRIVPHLYSVCCIVSTNAIHASNREFAIDRNKACKFRLVVINMTVYDLLINQSSNMVELSPDMVERHDAQQLLKRFIESGGYAPGDRLPAERELIDNLGITRSSLRKGLDALEREGTIWRHVGKGTFISEPTNPATFPGVDKLSQEISPIQMMRARLALEPVIAREAAINASTEAMRRIIVARDSAVEASSWKAYEISDDAFHRSIAQATDNALLLSLHDHLNQVHRTVAWRKVIRKTDRPSREHTSFAEHNHIVDAIDVRDPMAAHNSMTKVFMQP